MNSKDIVTNMKKTAQLVLLLALIVVAPRAFATTYYVDYTNGSDSNNGTSNATPWQHAPGMNGATGRASGTAINPGDSVILKGCVTWPNAALGWSWPYSGSVGNPIYIGVDKTWWDSTVSGCANAWNRPILDAQGVQVSPTTSFNYILSPANANNVTFDNFELKGLYSVQGPVNNESVFIGVGSNNTDVIFENLYVHGWVSPYFSIGTGNIAARSSTITNFVPFPYSPKPAKNWEGVAQAFVLHNPSNPSKGALYWPIQSNGPAVSSITNAGLDAWTIVTNSATSPSACNRCTVEIGADFTYIFAGNEAAVSGLVVQDSVIDGSDTLEAQLNPYTDCGASEGNNQWCGASGVAGWHAPNIWRDNVIRFVQAAMVGECTEWSGNLIEDIRFSVDPSAHTNGIECLDSAPVNGVLLKYGNVFRHTNVANANSDNGGQGSIGLPILDTPQGASTVEYDFNNVAYDTLQNAWLEFRVNGASGSVVVFNNTSDCGPSWNLIFGCVSTCPPGFVSCTMKDNHWVTNAINQFAGYACGPNCVVSNELVQTVAAANAQGYSESEPFAYSPGPKGGSTVGKGINAASICAAISAANPTAGTACLSDTPYAVSYNQTNHTVIVPARTPVVKPSGSTWDIGAYNAGSGSVQAPAPPSGLTAVVD